MSQPAFPGLRSPNDPDLSVRQGRVLAALVELHQRTARPVSSEGLAQSSDIGLSAASLRAELAELEGLGLLERQHSSGARVPTARGYELFVRTLLRPAVLSDAVRAGVQRGLEHSTRDVERLLAQASRVISSLSQQFGLAVATSLERERLVRLDLEPLGERRALMVLDLGAGAAQTLVFELESPLGRDGLEDVAQVLRARLVGHPLAEVRERLADDPELVRRSAVRIVARAAAASWARQISTPILSSGAVHIAEQPEFAGADRLSPILRAVEAGSPLDRLMVSSAEGQVAFRVGLEGEGGLAGCSLVSYAVPGPVRAAVGILGPTRMNYAHAFAVVEAVGVRLTGLLET